MKKLNLFLAFLMAVPFTACGLEDDPAGTISPECYVDADCAANQACDDGECVDLPECVVDADCAEGELCLSGECVADEPDPVEYLPAPFKSPAACIFDFSSYYTSGSICGELRGDIGGTTSVGWADGPQIYDADKDGYMGMSFTDAPSAGTYSISYVGFQNCSGQVPNESWAQYGSEDMLKRMTAEARAFIQCNWWDAANQKMVDVGSNPSCSLKINVDSACKITAAGNMANFQ